MTFPEKDSYYTEAEAAEVLGMKIQHMYGLVKRNKILRPLVRTEDELVVSYFARQDIDRYAKHQKANARDKSPADPRPDVMHVWNKSVRAIAARNA